MTRPFTFALAMLLSGCGASESELILATDRKARTIAESEAFGVGCKVLENPAGIDEDPNKIPYKVDCEANNVCSAGKDRVHHTDDDICVEIPSLVTPAELVREHIVAARQYLREDDHAAARKAILEARRLDLADPRIDAIEGRLRERVGEHDKALHLLQRALEKNPGSIDATIGLAEHYLGVVERFDAAKKDGREFPIYEEYIRNEGLAMFVKRMQGDLEPDDSRHPDLETLANRVDAQRERLSPLRESPGEDPRFRENILEELSADLGAELKD